jgi:hypothetical protein
MLGFILCLSLQAEVKIDKNKWGVIQHVMYKGYVMDRNHAITIMNKIIGKKVWVGKGKTLRSGNLFMSIKDDMVVVTSSYQLARKSICKPTRRRSS